MKCLFLQSGFVQVSALIYYFVYKESKYFTFFAPDLTVRNECSSIFVLETVVANRNVRSLKLITLTGLVSLLLDLRQNCSTNFKVLTGLTFKSIY